VWREVSAGRQAQRSQVVRKVLSARTREATIGCRERVPTAIWRPKLRAKGARASLSVRSRRRSSRRVSRGSIVGAKEGPQPPPSPVSLLPVACFGRSPQIVKGCLEPKASRWPAHAAFLRHAFVPNVASACVGGQENGDSGARRSRCIPICSRCLRRGRRGLLIPVGGVSGGERHPLLTSLVLSTETRLYWARQALGQRHDDKDSTHNHTNNVP